VLFYEIEHGRCGKLRAAAFTYLMDRDGSYLGFFPPGTPADRIADTLRPRVAE